MTRIRYVLEQDHEQDLGGPTARCTSRFTTLDADKAEQMALDNPNIRLSFQTEESDE